MTIRQMLSEDNISSATVKKFLDVEIVPKKLVDMVLIKIIKDYPFDLTAEEICQYILDLMNMLNGEEED